MGDEYNVHVSYVHDILHLAVNVTGRPTARVWSGQRSTSSRVVLIRWEYISFSTFIHCSEEDLGSASKSIDIPTQVACVCF